MSSLAEILSQRFENLPVTQPHLGKKPTKPPSGYNMFFQAQARRVRKREAALRLFEKRAASSSADPMEIAAAIGENFAELDQSPTKKSGGRNATKFIAGRWKRLSKEVKDMYALRAVAEFELYHVDKQCWIAFESQLQPEVRPLADSGLFSTETTKTKQKNIGEVPPPWHPTVSTQPGLPVPDSGAFAHGIHEGNEKYRHILIFLI